MRLTALLLSALGALVLSSCSANNNTSNNADWSISLGSSGGVTGGSVGTTIDADGHTTRWSTATATSGRQSEADRVLDKADAQFFRHYLDQIRFDTIASAEPSNKNLFVELTTSGTPRRVSWGLGNHAPSAGISALQRFYDVVSTYLSAQGGHQ